MTNKYSVQPITSKSGLVAKGQITITDLNDTIISTTPPTNPTKGMMWVDTSKTPPIMMTYDGAKWVVSNDVEIGTRNIILNSHFDSVGYKWSEYNSNGRSIVKEGRDGGYCAKTIGALKDTRNISQSTKKLKKNTEYIASFWCKTDNIVSGATNKLTAFYLSCNLNQIWKAEVAMGFVPIGTNEWHKVTTKFRTPNTDFDTCYMTLYARDFTGTIWWDELQLVEGNKSSDWSPAPEDLENSYTISTTTDSISIPTNINRLPISSKTYSTSIVVYQGSALRTDYTIGAISSANGITVVKGDGKVDFTVSNGTTLTADDGNFKIPITIDGKTFTKTFSWACSKQGQQGNAGTPAQYVTVSGEQTFKYTNNFSGNPTPTIIKLTAVASGITSPTYQWSYRVPGSTTTTNISGATSSVYDVTHNASFWGSHKQLTFRCTSSGKFDEITIVKVTDGAQGNTGASGSNGTNGTNGADAYTIVLTNESHAFPTENNGNIPNALSTSTDIIAYKGATRVATTISTLASIPGLTLTITNNSTTSAKITIQANTGTTLADTGTFDIGLTVDGKSFTKKFSWSKAKKGANGSNGTNGVGVSSIVEQYYLSTSNTTQTGGSWVTTPPAWANGKYMWTRSVINYTNGTNATTSPVCVSGSQGNTGSSGSNGANGVSVTKVDVEYAQTTSATTTPTTGWQTTSPTWANGKYIWSRTKTTYSSGNPTYTNPACITGQQGNNGSAGKGITSIVEYYLATSLASGVTTSTSGWTTTIQNMTTTNRYLWNYEVINYTDNSSTTVAPKIIGVYGNTGATGGTGATGNGISSIVNYYLATASSSGVTTSTSGWTTTVQAITTTNKYLWNYERINYTSGSNTTTTPAIIGAYGNTGNTGASGVSVTKVDVEYYLSTSSTTLSGGSWSTTAPTWVNGKYMWSRTKTTYSSGNPTYSQHACITGQQGNTGNTGGTGATGTGVSSITEEYYLSTSKTSQSGGSWTTTPPTWSVGKYMWTRSKIVYSNPTSTAYTTPICDSSWEAINDVEIGGMNVLNNTIFSITNDTTTAWSSCSGRIDGTYMGNNAYLCDNTSGSAYRDMLQQPLVNSKNAKIKDSSWYVFSFYAKGTIGKTLVTHVYPNIVDTTIKGYKDGSSISIGADGMATWNLTEAWARHVFIFKTKSNASTNTSTQSLLFRIQPSTSTSICMPQLEVGNKVSDWSPNPKDGQSQQDIFNKLTNNGEKQGLHIGVDGKIYLNGEYLQANTLVADKITSGTFRGTSFEAGGSTSSSNGVIKVKTDDDHVVFQADKHGVNLKQLSFQNTNTSGDWDKSVRGGLSWEGLSYRNGYHTQSELMETFSLVDVEGYKSSYMTAPLVNGERPGDADSFDANVLPKEIKISRNGKHGDASKLGSTTLTWKGIDIDQGGYNNGSLGINVLNNQFRIRIGGGGAIASGGFSIQGPGDTKLLNLDKDGNAQIRGMLNGCKIGGSGDYHGCIPIVGTNGVMEIGRYVDFHLQGSKADADGRIWQESLTGFRIAGNDLSRSVGIGIGGNDRYIHNNTSNKFLQLKDNQELHYDSRQIPTLVLEGGYLGIADSKGGNGAWFRTPKPGLIPYGHLVSSLGTQSWMYAEVHSNNIYMNNGARMYANTNDIIFNRTLLPHNTGVYQLGWTTNRWANIYATNGIIQTSDMRYKSDIVDIDDEIFFNMIKGTGVHSYVLNSHRVDIENPNEPNVLPLTRKTADQENIHVGILAQELAEFEGSEYILNYDEEAGYSVNNYNLTSAVMAALKVEISKREALEEKLKLIEEKLARV